MLFYKSNIPNILPTTYHKGFVPAFVLLAYH